MLRGGLGHASPSAKSKCGWDVSCLGMAQLNVQPPSSVKAAPSLLPTPLVPPYCLHAQEYVGPYPAQLAGAQDLSETEWSCISFLVQYIK